MAIRGYTSLSNIRFGHAVTWATALHLATGALVFIKNKPYRLPNTEPL